MNFSGLFCAAFFCSAVFYFSYAHMQYAPGRNHALQLTDRTKPDQRKNSPPVVKFVTPEHNRIYALNSLIPYSILISDPEDGESKYDEIPSREVLVELIYVDAVKGNFDRRQKTINHAAPGLDLMRSSDCFTCHQFKTTLIGPSFRDIAKRYSQKPSEIALVANRIREGSTGIWSDLVMPAHSDLSAEMAEGVVQWIMANGNDEKLNYLIGNEGNLKLELPAGAGEGYFILKAAYTDRGVPERPGEKLSGEDQIILRYR